MTYLNTEFSSNILSARILDEDNLHFENGLAIAKVYVRIRDVKNYEKNYTTYTVIQEVRNSQTNELTEYKLASNERYFELPAYILDIIRSGNHFIFKVRWSNDDETVFGEHHYHYEYDPEKDSFEKIGKLGGAPTLTRNPDVVILSNLEYSQLYHLGEKTLVGSRCSEIEDIDGNYFLVTNSIGVKKDGNAIRNNLIFVMYKDGNKVSKVYSRNKRDYTYDEIEVPYEEIEKREIQRLIDTLDDEENQKRLFRSCGNVEQ